MQLRIILGQALVEQYAAKHTLLKQLFRGKDILVQADKGISDVSTAGNHVFFGGYVVGLRTKDGWMDEATATSDKFRRFVNSHAALADVVKTLEGRFLFTRITKSGALELAPDRFGQRDMYYQEFKGGAVLASDLNLLPFKDSTIEYNQPALVHATYIYGYRPGKRDTFYKGVHRLGVGDMVTWKNGKLAIDTLPPPIRKTNKEYGRKELEEYTEILLDAVRKRSSSKGNIVYVSSGWDSTTLLACLVKLRGPKKVRALIGRMNFAKRSGNINPFEIARAKKVCDYFGVKLEYAEFDFVRRGPENVEKLEGIMKGHMLTSMAFFQWADLAAHVAKNYNGESVIAGEISDGVHNLGFSQFLTIFHPDLNFREYSDKMQSYIYGPSFLKLIHENRTGEDKVYDLLKRKFTGSAFDQSATDNVGKNRQMLSSFFLRDNRFPLWSIKNCKMFTAKARQGYTKHMESTYLDKAAKDLNYDNLYSWYIHLYNSFHWQGGTVSTIAFTAEHYGIDVKLPYYDSRLQEFLSAAPENWGRGLEIRPTKYPLKWMLENKVDYPLHLQVGPHSYTYDIDPNFNHGAEFIYKSSFAPLIKQRLKERRYEKLLSKDYFDMTYINKIVNRYLNGIETIGAERADLEILCYLVLEGWY